MPIKRTAEQPFSAWLDSQPKLLLAVAAAAFHTLLYSSANHFQLVPARTLEMGWLDTRIPFIPQTGWVYWSDYLLVFTGFWLCRPKGTTAQFLKGFAALIAAGATVHGLYPIVYPRDLYPVPAGTDPITQAAIKVFRVVDTPASCVPSLHVAVCCLVVFALWPFAPRIRWVFLVWACAVAVSTLTFKQHYFIDLIAGLVLAGGVWLVFYRWLPYGLMVANTYPQREQR